MSSILITNNIQTDRKIARKFLSRKKGRCSHAKVKLPFLDPTMVFDLNGEKIKLMDTDACSMINPRNGKVF